MAVLNGKVYYISGYAGGSFYLNRWGSGAVSNHQNVTLYSKTPDPDQQWFTQPVTGDYQLLSMLNKAYGLNIYPPNNNNCDLYPVQGNEYDALLTLQAVDASRNIYRIKLANYNYYLTAASNASGANVCWAASSSSASQQWKFEEVSSGGGSGDYGYPTDTSHRTLSRGFSGASHRGIDIIGDTGTAIYAFADGIVAFRQNYNGNIYPDGDSNSMESMGNLLCINHYNPNTSIASGPYVQTVYMHMNSIAVSQGATVTKGQVIGYMGNTGYSSNTHLHFNLGVGSRTSMKPGYSGYTGMGNIGVIDPRLYLPDYHS